MTKRILFVHYGDNWIRGSEKCLLDLIHYVSRHQYQPVVWTNNRELASVLAEIGVAHKTDDFPVLLGWKAPKLNIKAWYHLMATGRALIEQNNIDLVHINSAAPCQWMVAAAKICGVPSVTQLHCPYPARDRLTLGMHLSPHVIAVSHHVAKPMLEDGFPANKMSVIHNGIDTQALEAQPKIDVKAHLGIPSEDFVFATVGSLIHRKGVDRILTAMRHIAFEYRNVSLVVIGDGPLRNTLERQAEYLHLADRIYFTGEQRQVIGWLKGCDGFISAARSEAFGLVIAEAALAKVPIIAPFEGGIPEFIQHGETGILYPNKGVNPLAKAMRILINNRALGEKYAANAYQHIKTQHDLSISCDRIEAVYQTLLASPSKSRSIVTTLSPIRTYLTRRMSMGAEHG
ncbi:glycosyltransferase family 4 protein [Vibrio sp. JPW-9-11-11]|uniref:glycosyltransferase family 4 protein n=1 Tax=Vibrio sp. JPW-9-11-11 TaxID=1416532 RepID=UPI001594D7AD|nr:glycosyltransferase family 4 protein [Vibrio sp. JPW-9-11-11]NVD06714.1 glycosyltransferase family 4 protein [Vibrio sp. JPW-9-11-11]